MKIGDETEVRVEINHHTSFTIRHTSFRCAALTGLLATTARVPGAYAPGYFMAPLRGSGVLFHEDW